MSRFSTISIIYNPNSTGSGKTLAQELRRELAQFTVGKMVKLIRTEHAGHAETLAYDLAKASRRPLIISASGDGGYHEVINGLLRAQAEGASPTAGLLPGGNANDHYNAIHEENVVQRIVRGASKPVDILQLRATSKGAEIVRYAHSYIGFGLTPEIGSELNKTDLNPFNELLLVLKGLFSFRPVRIERDGKRQTYDSLICSNISTMSKILTLSKEADPRDGKFELSLIRRHTKTRLIRKLLRASLSSLDHTTQYKTYSFNTFEPINAQLDGEIYPIDGKSRVVITCVPGALHTII